MSTLPLFDKVQQPMMPDSPPTTDRREMIAAAFHAADARFREEYLAMAMRWIEQGREFTGEDLQNAYRRRADLPQPREWRATGGIIQGLVRRGIIVAVGYRKRNQGNITAVYRQRWPQG